VHNIGLKRTKAQHYWPGLAKEPTQRARGATASQRVVTARRTCVRRCGGVLVGAAAVVGQQRSAFDEREGREGVTPSNGLRVGAHRVGGATTGFSD
jgi:hypothetical protein